MSRRELAAMVGLVLFAVGLVVAFILLLAAAIPQRPAPPAQAPAATWTPRPLPTPVLPTPPHRQPPLGPWGDTPGIELDSP